jgi:hypothetical protein
MARLISILPHRIDALDHLADEWASTDGTPAGG